MVLVYENFVAQSVVMTGSLRAGSTLEASLQNGLAALTTSALMRGTQTRDFTTLHAALEDIGADFNISAGGHRTSFGGKALAEDLPVLVDLLADVVRRPAFPAAQVERLRSEVLTGLRIRQNDTRYRATRAFAQALYPPGHPYHYSVRGSLESVAELTLGALMGFHRAHFGPRGMIIVIVGAVRADEAIETVRAALEDWTNEEQTDPRTLQTLPRPTESQRVNVELAGKTQSDIVLGTLGPARLAPDYHAAQLANSILGQFGMMGRIGAIVREELGLAYYASSSLEGGHGQGAWSVSAGVNPANLELALERIRAEVRRLTAEPVSAEDLSDNQSYYTGHLPLQLETNEGIAGTLHSMEIYNLGLDYLVDYPARINALTREDLLAAARRYLDADALVVATAGPPV
jgi:zinc protease